MHAEKQMIGDFFGGQFVRVSRGLFLRRDNNAVGSDVLWRLGKNQERHGSFVAVPLQTESARETKITKVGHCTAVQSKRTRREKQTHHRVAQIVAAIAIGAIAVLPCFAPKDRRERDDQRRFRGPREIERAREFAGPVAAAAKLERMTIGAIVIETVIHSGESARR